VGAASVAGSGTVDPTSGYAGTEEGHVAGHQQQPIPRSLSRNKESRPLRRQKGSLVAGQHPLDPTAEVGPENVEEGKAAGQKVLDLEGKTIADVIGQAPPVFKPPPCPQHPQSLSNPESHAPARVPALDLSGLAPIGSLEDPLPDAPPTPPGAVGVSSILRARRRPEPGVPAPSGPPPGASTGPPRPATPLSSSSQLRSFGTLSSSNNSSSVDSQNSVLFGGDAGAGMTRGKEEHHC
jgi:hypothetical protein